jgi:nucleoside-diphosphate-sugar epimerase
MTRNLLIFGHGYTGRAIAQEAAKAGFVVTITSRTPNGEPGVIPFAEAAAAIAQATHIVATAAPGDAGDPVLAAYKADIAAAPNLAYIGYLSTTGVYGNRDGGWVDEDTPPAAQSPRAQRRVAAEVAWADFARPDDAAASAAKSESGRAKTIDIFRLAGIYGPGRSMFDDLREGTARRVVKPGHLFGRIHRDDIAQGVLKAMQRNAPPGVSIFNFSDDEPAASADVVVEAARLLGVPPPDPVAYADAAPRMTPMGLSFWAENRRVANAKTKAALGLTWRYPTYREGLAGILSSEKD